MYYKTSFKGDFSLSFLTEPQIDTLISYIQNNAVLSDVANVDKHSKVIYFSGDVDDSSEIVEDTLLKISQFAPEDFTATIEAQGASVKDRRDLIIKESSLFVLSYDLVPGDCVRYQTQS